ncbi:ABC transporter ATP-binding protein [Clostridium akagii]|uniref:ABC transporter ATP-binding protein n=1 Tax=Clostridium akagii TaxID=91623 RepID=UPI00047C6130|nr:ABC transporter ATP-binding protein [Clostridium akagii]
MSLKKSNITDIVNLPFKYAKKESVLIGIKIMLDGLAPVIEALIIAKLLDIAILILKNQKKMSDIIITILLMTICIGYDLFSEQIEKVINVRMNNKLRQNIRVNFVEKIASLDYCYIENQDSWDLISRVIREPEVKCNNAYTSILRIISMIINVLGVLIILFSKVWWATIVICMFSIPVFYLSLKGGRAIYEVDRNVEKNKRKATYLGEVLRGRESVEEREIFEFCEKINNEWFKQYEIAIKEQLKVDGKWYINAKLSGIGLTILFTVIVLILIFPVVNRKITIGMFISIVSTLFNLINDLSWSLPEYGNELAKSKEYLVDLDNFINLKGNNENLEKPAEESIKIETLEFKNVCFRYPGMKKYVLKGLSFRIEAGKHYSFVGTNGAGKTTIIKLITGLYEEFEGKILINGKSIEEYSKDKIKSMFSVEYQDFAKYYISLKDNILIGDINGKYNNKNVNNKLKNLIETVQLEDIVERLYDGINSNLGKIKSNGVDLSGGEWQRVAISRLMMNSTSLTILDEPTAALDPISENNLYENFEKINESKTTIFISHRLASTKISDKIFVLDDGNIVESGSYEQLMEQDGIYATMYESQKSWYTS